MLRWVAVKLIKVYQVVISPVLPQSCKYYPSCSHYALEAIEKKGFMLGFVKSCWRLLRCNPWSQGGFDPVEKE